MRWYWIDRFLEFVSGHHAVAIKCVAMAESHLHDSFKGYPTHPLSLVIEGMAQTGGLLVLENCNFEKKVILAKISKASFNFLPRPGEQLRFEATIVNTGEEGASVEGTVTSGDRLLGPIDLFFAYLPERIDNRETFTPDDYLAMLRQLRFFEVAVDQAGNPVETPAIMVAHEQAQFAAWSAEN